MVPIWFSVKKKVVAKRKLFVVHIDSAVFISRLSAERNEWEIYLSFLSKTARFRQANQLRTNSISQNLEWQVRLGRRNKHSLWTTDSYTTQEQQLKFSCPEDKSNYLEKANAVFENMSSSLEAAVESEEKLLLGSRLRFFSFISEMGSYVVPVMLGKNPSYLRRSAMDLGTPFDG